MNIFIAFMVFVLQERFKKLLMTLGATLLLSFASTLSASEELSQETLWDKLRSGNHFVLIRHALAPGTGDPEHFVIDRRDTQRNLSQGGITQAKRIGDLFKSKGIRSGDVFSSQWYRCLDTAKLLDLGPVNELTALNSFYRNADQQVGSTNALKQWITNKRLDEPVVLVTHQVNITALTGVYPSSGEIVFATVESDNRIRVIGTIDTL